VAVTSTTSLRSEGTTAVTSPCSELSCVLGDREGADERQTTERWTEELGEARLTPLEQAWQAVMPR
jgi:hypothetical protein